MVTSRLKEDLMGVLNDRLGSTLVAELGSFVPMHSIRI